MGESIPCFLLALSLIHAEEGQSLESSHVGPEQASTLLHVNVVTFNERVRNVELFEKDEVD